LAGVGRGCLTRLTIAGLLKCRGLLSLVWLIGLYALAVGIDDRRS
jgi:hypothetical protein